MICRVRVKCCWMTLNWMMNVINLVFFYHTRNGMKKKLRKTTAGNKKITFFFNLIKFIIICFNATHTRFTTWWNPTAPTGPLHMPFLNNLPNLNSINWWKFSETLKFYASRLVAAINMSSYWHKNAGSKFKTRIFYLQNKIGWCFQILRVSCAVILRLNSSWGKKKKVPNNVILSSLLFVLCLKPICEYEWWRTYFTRAKQNKKIPNLNYEKSIYLQNNRKPKCLNKILNYNFWRYTDD